MLAKQWIFIIIIVGLLIAILVTGYVFRKSDTSVASKKVDAELSASQLLGNYEDNEENANKQYLGKILVVTGKVDSVSEDSLGFSVYLKEDGFQSGVICSFDKENMKTSINKGMLISIKGICDGYLIDVIMNKCSVVPLKHNE